MERTAFKFEEGFYFSAGHVFEDAWHFQRPRSPKSNQDIFEWSLRPTNYANFALIGEAYNLNYAAWCDGAMRSSMAVLEEHYNFSYPCCTSRGGNEDFDLRDNPICQTCDDVAAAIGRKSLFDRRLPNFRNLLPW